MSDPTCAIVVAHPDDEALWFSSVLSRAGRTIFCFGDVLGRPEKSSARRRAIARLPLHGVRSIGLPESGVKLAVDWSDPQPTRTGIAIREPGARRRYEANFESLTAALRTELAGVETVYTHNPWGEYGHAEHIQVFRAVSNLREALGYIIWVPNYVGRKSLPLARRLRSQIFWTAREHLPTDRKTAREIMRVYRRCGAWTWARGHRWPAMDTLYRLWTPNADDRRFPLSGEWLMDADRSRWWRLSLPCVHRRL